MSRTKEEDDRQDGTVLFADTQTRAAGGGNIALCPRFAPPDMNIFFAEFEMAKCVIANEETKINSVITKK